MSIRDTSKLLIRLRALMKDLRVTNGKQLEAYIVPSSDAHGSEYISEKDKRRQFISKFSGSAGTAVVTEHKALLWTDGRYYLQASEQLDQNWQLMKDGLAETPTIGDWLCQNLPANSLVGIDGSLYEEDQFQTLALKLKSNNSELLHIQDNIVDIVWHENGKEELILKPLIKLDVNYIGQSTSEKLKQIRSHLQSLNLDALIVSSLDEISWLLNIRGSDIPYGTVFFAYLIITNESCKLFTNLKRLDENYETNKCFKSYLQNEDSNFEFYEYEQFFSYLNEFVQKELVEKYKNKTTTKGNAKKIYLSSASSHAIHSTVPYEFIHKDISYLNKLKVIKTSTEIESAKRVHIRDSKILVEFFHLLTKHFNLPDDSSDELSTFELNEYNLAEYIDNMRKKTLNCLSPSFETICSSGSNCAIIHYKPSEESCKKVERNNIFLLDSGGHYLDLGTTDVTRTVYLGDTSQLTQYEKECFTRVLKGHIQLATRIFPNGTRPELLDSFARQALWQAGLDYRHGTGHGVGALLNVHEYPIIANRKINDIGVQENMIITIEPGYYEDGKFGIRIENCELTVKADTPYSYSNIQFIKFEPLTLVPIQREFIDKNLLDLTELNWLNDYHKKCLEIVGNELKLENKFEVYEWLVEQTKPL